jgi:hypothetical protein
MGTDSGKIKTFPFVLDSPGNLPLHNMCMESEREREREREREHPVFKPYPPPPGSYPSRCVSL